MADKKPDTKAMLREWSHTPSPNPRYKGATPADVARALLRKKPVRRDERRDQHAARRAR